MNCSLRHLRTTLLKFLVDFILGSHRVKSISEMADQEGGMVTVDAAQAPTKRRKHLAKADQAAAIVASPGKPMAAGRRLPLLICSIGNPGKDFANTYHSAGHAVLTRLAEHLGHSGFSRHHDKFMQKGLVSELTNPMTGTQWTLWQSTQYMNESGKGVVKAFEGWSRHLLPDGGRLIVIHDELEKPLGNVSTKTNPSASAKGHNGIKSIMKEVGNKYTWARIGIGIGRPESREREDVSTYVLKKMGPDDKKVVEDTFYKVIEQLQLLEVGWKDS